MSVPLSEPIYAPLAPIVTQQRCIVEDGVRYCEESPVSSRNVGYAILGFTAVCVYIIILADGNVKGRIPGLVCWVGILGPIVLVSLFLVFK